MKWPELPAELGRYLRKLRLVSIFPWKVVKTLKSSDRFSKVRNAPLFTRLTFCINIHTHKISHISFTTCFSLLLKIHLSSQSPPSTRAIVFFVRSSMLLWDWREYLVWRMEEIPGGGCLDSCTFWRITMKQSEGTASQDGGVSSRWRFWQRGLGCDERCSSCTECVRPEDSSLFPRPLKTGEDHTPHTRSS